MTELTQLLNTPDWSAESLAMWAEPWLNYLHRHANADMMLPGRFLDCHPCNLIRRAADGALQSFDLEWDMSEMLALRHVMLRGLGSCLSRYQSVATPQVGTSTDVLRLSLDVLEHLDVRFTDADVAAYFAFETDFQFEVYGRRETFFSGCTLQVRPASWAAHLRALHERADAHTRQQRQLNDAFKMAPEVVRSILEPVFDAEFYNMKYPDVPAAHVEPLDPLRQIWRARRPPAQRLVRRGLLPAALPRRGAAVHDPLVHYVLIGKHQDRRFGPKVPENQPVEQMSQSREFSAVKMARRFAQSIISGGEATD